MIEPLVLVLTTAVPALDAFAGDHILIRPGHEYPIVLERDLSDSAALEIGALAAGQFEVLSAHDVSEVQLLCGSSEALRLLLRLLGASPDSSAVDLE